MKRWILYSVNIWPPMPAMIRTVSSIVQWGVMNAMAAIKTPVMIQIEAWLYSSANRVTIARLVVSSVVVSSVMLAM